MNKTTLTKEQRQELCDLWEQDVRDPRDVADQFKEWRPKSYARALKRVCKLHEIIVADVDTGNDEWRDTDTDDFWLDVKNEIFELCGIDYNGGYWQLEEDIKND